jgi:UDP-N-acetylmuramate--alanine ligase
MQLDPSQKIHFIGLGGVSMSGLAHALADRGYRVSGSDKADSERLATLREAGLEVHVGHDPAWVTGADVVVRTTAIRDDNPELQAAVAAHKIIYHRSEVLAWMLRGKRPLAITGTHGKTTTTALTALVFAQAGADPTAFIGGDLRNWGANYRLGAGPHVVFEACESDSTFLRYHGCSQIITGIEPDHLDQHGTVEALEAAFAQFLTLADPNGFVVWHRACPVLREIIPLCPARPISYGLTGAADYSADQLNLQPGRTTFRLLRHGAPAGEFTLQVPGEHNVLNALAALAAAEACSLNPEAIREGLAAFQGTGRRFELLGEGDGIAIYDDYAHHPTEVRATLAAARSYQPERLVAIFQPHLYSRTRDLMADFTEAFTDADIIVITDIYAAREDPITGVSAGELARRLQARHPDKQVLYCPSLGDVVDTVAALAQAGDLIMTLGAGDVCTAGEALVKRLLGACPR